MSDGEPPNAVSGFTARIRELLGRSTTWVLGCVAAAAAVVVTAAVSDVGRSAGRIAQEQVCTLTSPHAPDQAHFRVVVARLENDPDGDAQERIASALVPTSFSVVRGCNEGPRTLDRNGAPFDDRARAEATRQLTAMSADVLVFGRVEGDKAKLRFADRNGYCSHVTKEVPLADLNQELARSALARALAASTIKSLVSDCKGDKMKRLDERELSEFSKKLHEITDLYGRTGEPDLKFNLWTYQAWVDARLAILRGGASTADQAVEDIVAAAPDSFAKAASLWGLKLCAERMKLPQMRVRVLDEAFVATQTWDQSRPSWVSVAVLAGNRLEAEHAADRGWKLKHYDGLTDRAAGNGDDTVPMPDGEVARAFYRFAEAVLEAQRPSDQQVENAVSVLTDLLKKKVGGESVPVTTNSLRYQLARAHVMSAHRQRAPSRLLRAQELLSFIEAHPDDSTELTPELLKRLRNDIQAECSRSGSAIGSCAIGG